MPDLLELIRGLKITHHVSEDCWYTCPANNLEPDNIEQCCREGAGTECDCGADKHNAKVDEVLSLLGAETIEDEAETDRFLLALGHTYREELARKIADEAERQYVNTPLQPGFLRAASFHDLVYQAASKILSTE